MDIKEHKKGVSDAEEIPKTVRADYIELPVISDTVLEFIEGTKDERLEDLLINASMRTTTGTQGTTYTGQVKEADQLVLESFNDFYIARTYGYQTKDGEVVRHSN